MQLGERFLLLEHLQTGQSGGAAEGISAITVAVVERFHFLDAPKEGIVNFACRQRGAERQVTTRNAFGKGKEIGDDILMLAGKHFSCASESSHDFIADEERFLPVTPLAHGFQRALRPDFHACSTLHSGLNRDPGNAVHHFIGDVKQRVSVLDVMDAKSQMLEPSMKRADASQRGGSQRVAVIGVIES